VQHGSHDGQKCNDASKAASAIIETASRCATIGGGDEQGMLGVGAVMSAS
jgi:hypothetical protein